MAAKGKALALSGAMSFDFTPDQGGTKLDLTYAVGGYLAAGLNTLAAPVDGVLTAQMGRLKNLVELGRPEPSAQWRWGR